MNKKILLLVTISILSILSIQAQQSRYGFRLGLNYSDIDFDDSSFGIQGNKDKAARYGFAAGFFATFFISEKFSVQPELQYAALGEKTKVLNNSSFNPNGSLSNNISTDNLKINTLQLPVLLNFHIGEKFTLSAGPQAGIRIWEWERETDYETVQFSALGGIGYDINDNLGVNLRASYGLTDVIDTSKESTFKATGVNHYVQLSVTYRL